MYRAPYLVATFLLFVASGCAYVFGEAESDGGGSGGGGDIYVVAGNGATDQAAANASGVASTGSLQPPPLPDCGNFEDGFDVGDRWIATHVVFSGGRASTLGETMEDPEDGLLGGEILTRSQFAVGDCFLSLSVSSAATRGLTYLAIENGASREDAFELEIGPRIETANDERGVQAVDFLDGEGDVLAPFIRVKQPTHLGIWVDASAGRMRGYVRTASGDWFSVGERDMPSYVQSTRFNAASLAATELPDDAKAIFDNLNVLDVTAVELAAAKPFAP